MKNAKEDPFFRPISRRSSGPLVRLSVPHASFPKKRKTASRSTASFNDAFRTRVNRTPLLTEIAIAKLPISTDSGERVPLYPCTRTKQRGNLGQTECVAIERDRSSSRDGLSPVSGNTSSILFRSNPQASRSSTRFFSSCAFLYSVAPAPK